MTQKIEVESRVLAWADGKGGVRQVLGGLFAGRGGMVCGRCLHPAHKLVRGTGIVWWCECDAPPGGGTNQMALPQQQGRKK